jgi:endo-alpha-N-acetylgalactosaminidase
LSQQPLAGDSAYVVTPQLAEVIARGPTGPGKCHDVDQFILCSTKTDFGLGPVLMTPEERVENSVANAGFEDGDLAPWSTNGMQASVSSAHAHSGSQSLAESGGGTMYQDINGLEPGRTYTLSAWVSAVPGTPATAQLTIFNPTDNTAVSSSAVHADPGWQLVSRSFTVGGEGAVRIHLARGPGEGAVYWDDVHISAGEKQ